MRLLATLLILPLLILTGCGDNDEPEAAVESYSVYYLVEFDENLSQFYDITAIYTDASGATVTKPLSETTPLSLTVPADAAQQGVVLRAVATVKDPLPAADAARDYRLYYWTQMSVRANRADGSSEKVYDREKADIHVVRGSQMADFTRSHPTIVMTDFSYSH